MPDVTLGSSIQVVAGPDGVAEIRLPGGALVTCAAGVDGGGHHPGRTALRVAGYDHWFPNDNAGCGTLGAALPDWTCAADGDAAVVRQYFEHGEATIRLTACGPDLRAEVTIQNTGPLPLRWHGLQLCSFDSTLRARLSVQEWGQDYTAPAGKTILDTIPLRGGTLQFVDGADVPYGVGVSVRGLGWRRVLWTYPTYALCLLTDREIPAGGTLTYTVTLRVSRNLDRDHLLSPYYADFAAEFGSPLYDPDNRPWVGYTRCGPEAVTPDNPLGYHDAWRFDRREGMQQMGSQLVPVMQQIGLCQGLMAWLVEYDPLSGEAGYSADFHKVGRAVAAALPLLLDALALAGMKFGKLARPGFRLRFPSGLALAANEAAAYEPVADTPESAAEMLARFQALAALGCRGSYLDDYIRAEARRVLWFVRVALGRDYQWYFESVGLTDLAALLGGVYTTVGAGPGGGYVLSRGEEIAVLRHLWPQMPVLVRYNEDLGQSREAFVDWCVARKLSPLFGDHELCTTPGLAAYLAAALQGKLVQTPAGWDWV